VITIAGTGPGDGRYALPQVREKALSCSLLAGYSRVLKPFLTPGKPVLDFSAESAGLKGGLARIDALRHREDICLLVSGDPGFHSLLGTVRRLYPRWEYHVLPGLSAFQVVCAKIGQPWQGMALISCHGSGGDPADLPGDGFRGGAVILTDKDHTPGEIARSLLPESGKKRLIWIGTDMGTLGERLESMSLEEAAERTDWVGLCTIVMPPSPTGKERIQDRKEDSR